MLGFLMWVLGSELSFHACKASTFPDELSLQAPKPPSFRVICYTVVVADTARLAMGNSGGEPQDLGLCPPPDFCHSLPDWFWPTYPFRSLSLSASVRSLPDVF